MTQGRPVRYNIMDAIILIVAVMKEVNINSFHLQQSKGGILAKACDYIQDMRAANQRLAEALRQSEHHVEELQAENAALRKELEHLQMGGPKS